MRVVIQRVSDSSVEINGKITGAIGVGLLILVGFEEADTAEDVHWMAGKVARLRIFDDDQGVMNLSAKEIDGEALVVSQFTLHAKTKKGNRPSYIMAARPETAIPLYKLFIEKLNQELDKPVKAGVFGAMMRVAMVNDGPVTIIIDSKHKE